MSSTNSSNNTPEVWFAIPSANPENCRRVLPVWREMGYKIAVLQNRVKAEIPADLVMWWDHYPGWPESTNILCRELVKRGAEIVVGGGDDMLPDPSRTAQEIAREFVEYFKGTMGVMQPHGDRFGHTHEICGSPWMGREWIERAYGGRGAMPGMYHHNWADVEMFLVTHGLGLLWSRGDLAQRHEHFMRAGESKPEYWRMEVENTDLVDLEKFLARADEGFPGCAPIGWGGPTRVAVTGTVQMENARQRLLALAQRRKELTGVLRGLADAGEETAAIACDAPLARALLPAIETSPVTIACIIDDPRAGKPVAGVPVVSVREAAVMGIRSVVLIAGADDDVLWERLRPLLEAGVRITRVGLASKAEKRDRLEYALVGLARAGLRRVAVFGAGEHTRGAAAVLQKNRVVAVVDDNPALVGSDLGGAPIVSIAQAAGMNLDAVVLSSDAHEARMLEASEPFRRAGLRVVRLYGPDVNMAAPAAAATR